jgi:hypothetical protein
MKETSAVSGYISFETWHTVMVGDVQVLDVCQNFSVVPYLNI